MACHTVFARVDAVRARRNSYAPGTVKETTKLQGTLQVSHGGPVEVRQPAWARREVRERQSATLVSMSRGTEPTAVETLEGLRTGSVLRRCPVSAAGAICCNVSFIGTKVLRYSRDQSLPHVAGAYRGMEVRGTNSTRCIWPQVFVCWFLQDREGENMQFFLIKFCNFP